MKEAPAQEKIHGIEIGDGSLEFAGMILPVVHDVLTRTYKNILTNMQEHANLWVKGVNVMDKFITIDRQLAREAEAVLDEVGIDMETVVKMMLKRVVREQGIAFLTSKFDEPASKFTNQPMVRMADGKIGKSQAVALFSAQGVHFNRNITYASKNKTAFNYWANPFFTALDEDWYLILNDWINRELHLFFIPAKSIAASELVARFDKKDKVDLQICYNDPTFTDNRSKISFARYLVKDISY